MLYYWLHVLYIFIGSKFKWKKVGMTTSISRSWWVKAFDCEGFRFMSNSKYIYYMDFIRFELLFRSKLYDQTVKKGIFPVLGSQKIIYKKPLKMWTKFEISLNLEGWDEKWVYHKQVFTQNNEICAVGYTKAAFWLNKKIVSTEIILANCGEENTKPQHPKEEILKLFENDFLLLRN